MRIGTPSAAPSRQRKSPTAMATRYDDILGVGANTIVCCVTAGPGVSESTLPFETAMSPRSRVTVNEYVALNDGSSKHGNARRASVDSNWVTAYFRSFVLLM